MFNRFLDIHPLVILHVLNGIVVFFFGPWPRNKNNIGGRKREKEMSGPKRPSSVEEWKTKEQGNTKRHVTITCASIHTSYAIAMLKFWTFIIVKPPEQAWLSCHVFKRENSFNHWQTHFPLLQTSVRNIFSMLFVRETTHTGELTREGCFLYIIWVIQLEVLVSWPKQPFLGECSHFLGHAAVLGQCSQLPGRCNRLLGRCSQKLLAIQRLFILFHPFDSFSP